MTSSSPSLPLLGAVVLVPILVVIVGCDAVPGLQSGTRQSPRVADLQVATDSIQVLEADSLARLTLNLSARAADPDGAVVRVVFLLEPSSNPRGTASGELRSGEGSLYAGRVQFAVPLVEEIYTVRVFAVDDDSLTSNQVTGQFRFDPSQQSNAAAAGSLANTSTGRFALQAVRPRLLVIPTLHNGSVDPRSVQTAPQSRGRPVWAFGRLEVRGKRRHTPTRPYPTREEGE